MSDLTDEEILATRILNKVASKEELYTRIKQLEEENRKLKNKAETEERLHLEMRDKRNQEERLRFKYEKYVEENNIPKQKIKDLIKELESQEIYGYASDFYYLGILYCTRELNKLLEEGM